MSVRPSVKRRLRRWWWCRHARRNGASLGANPQINYRTELSSNTSVGTNFNSNGLEVHGPGSVTIGDNFHCGRNCVIITANHDYDHGGAIPYGDTYVVKDTTIGDNVWLGLNVIILPGVRIGEGAIVQAGSVVTSDIPAFAIAGGHPARRFATRNVEHYETLKQLERFN